MTINENVDRGRRPAKTTNANRSRTAGKAARMSKELVDRELVPLLDDAQLLDLGAAVISEMSRRFRTLFLKRPMTKQEAATYA